MTAVLIVSDSHGFLKGIEKLLSNEAGNYDMVIHLGDGIQDFRHYSLVNYYCIRGNMDDVSSWPAPHPGFTAIINIENIRTLLTHGHKLNVKNGPYGLISEAKRTGVRLALYGHTHKPFSSEIDGVMYFNPGALKDFFYGKIKIDGDSIISTEHLVISI